MQSKDLTKGHCCGLLSGCGRGEYKKKRKSRKLTKFNNIFRNDYTYSSATFDVLYCLFSNLAACISTCVRKIEGETRNV